MVAEIPVEKLKRSAGLKTTPPIDVNRLTPDEIKRGLDIPYKTMVEIIQFKFQIKDRSGSISSPGYTGSMLHIGLASEAYAPVRDSEGEKSQ